MEQRLHQIFDLLGDVPFQNRVAAVRTRGYGWDACDGDHGVAVPINLGGNSARNHWVIAYWASVHCAQRFFAITHILAKLG